VLTLRTSTPTNSVASARGSGGDGGPDRRASIKHEASVNGALFDNDGRRILLS